MNEDLGEKAEKSFQDSFIRNLNGDSDLSKVEAICQLRASYDYLDQNDLWSEVPEGFKEKIELYLEKYE